MKWNLLWKLGERLMNKRLFLKSIHVLFIFILIFSLMSLNMPAQALAYQEGLDFQANSLHKISAQDQQVIDQ